MASTARSTEPWAVRQGEELCRALATTEPLARRVLLAPLSTGRAISLTDGPWIPLKVLARLAAQRRQRLGTKYALVERLLEQRFADVADHTRDAPRPLPADT